MTAEIKIFKKNYLNSLYTFVILVFIWKEINYETNETWKKSFADTCQTLKKAHQLFYIQPYNKIEASYDQLCPCIY